MKKMICIFVLAAIFAACGSGSSSSSSSDTSMKMGSDTSMHGDSSNMMKDTTKH